LSAEIGASVASKGGEMRSAIAKQGSAMRVQQFAETLGISVHCARSWAYQRKIASIKLGKLLFIPTSEIDRLLEENLVPAVSGRQ
jgi:excisionase family DNA binding protein